MVGNFMLYKNCEKISLKQSIGYTHQVQTNNFVQPNAQLVMKFPFEKKEASKYVHLKYEDLSDEQINALFVKN
jgi:hypothetical protein